MLDCLTVIMDGSLSSIPLGVGILKDAEAAEAAEGETNVAKKRGKEKS